MSSQKELEAAEEAIGEERKKHYIIINYILNKNSHTLPRAVDLAKAYDDMQEYESYLAEEIYG